MITDSQVFVQVERETPDEILLTSFSYSLRVIGKPERSRAPGGHTGRGCRTRGIRCLSRKDDVHHRQCDDIGTVKMGNGSRAYTGRRFILRLPPGKFPEELSEDMRW